MATSLMPNFLTYPARVAESRQDLGRSISVATTGQGSDGEISIPQARPGIPIPYLIGRQRVFAPNTIWAGNVRPVIEVEQSVEQGPTDYEWSGDVWKVEVTTETVTTVYRTVGYNMSLQFSICLGPGAVLKAMGVGDTVIWSGTAGPGKTEFTVPANNSVISGDVIFYGGQFDQTPDPWLAQFVPAGQLPGYIGVAHIIVKDLRVDQLSSEYPWFEIERFPNPLGLSSGNNRMGDDINVASAAADYIGSDWGGAGAGTDTINNSSFTSAALALAGEGNACSFQLTTETNAAAVISYLMAQADGIVFEDPASGEVHMRLLRRSLIDPLTAKRVTAGTTSRINRWERQAWPETFNKMRVGYNRRDRNYQSDNLFGYTFNAITDRFKANRSTALEFPLCNTTDVAKALLKRELGKAGVPRSAGEVEVSRATGAALPGDGIHVILQDRLAPVPGFITKVRRMSLRDNRVILGFVEVPTQNNNVVFDAETGLGVPITIGPNEPTAVLIKQPPMWLARQVGDSNMVVSQQTRAMILPRIADNLQASFSAWIANKPGTADLVSVIQGAPYPTYGTLGADIGQFTNMDTGVLASVTLSSVLNPIFLESFGTTGVRSGRALLMIDDEILSFESASENIDGSWTLTNVHRALLDTAPQAHTAGAACHVIGNNYSIVSGPFTLPLGYTPQWRISSNTAYAEGNAETDYLSWATWDVSYNRVRIPVRPHNTKIDGAARSTSLLNIFGEVGTIVTRGQNIDLTWNTRSRTSLVVALQLDAPENSEQNTSGLFQKHRVLIRDSGNTLRDCGVTGDDANYNTLTATVPALTALGRGNLFLRAELGSLQSKFEDQIPVFVMETDYFVNEDEDAFWVSENGSQMYVAQ